MDVSAYRLLRELHNFSNLLLVVSQTEHKLRCATHEGLEPLLCQLASASVCACICVCVCVFMSEVHKYIYKTRISISV